MARRKDPPTLSSEEIIEKCLAAGDIAGMAQELLTCNPTMTFGYARVMRQLQEMLIASLQLNPQAVSDLLYAAVVP